MRVFVRSLTNTRQYPKTEEVIKLAKDAENILYL